MLKSLLTLVLCLSIINCGEDHEPQPEGFEGNERTETSPTFKKRKRTKPNRQNTNTNSDSGNCSDTFVKEHNDILERIERIGVTARMSNQLACDGIENAVAHIETFVQKYGENYSCEAIVNFESGTVYVSNTISKKNDLESLFNRVCDEENHSPETTEPEEGEVYEDTGVASSEACSETLISSYMDIARLIKLVTDTAQTSMTEACTHMTKAIGSIQNLIDTYGRNFRCESNENGQKAEFKMSMAIEQQALIQRAYNTHCQNN